MDESKVRETRRARMAKTAFRDLPIYKAIRRSKLSKRVQNEVLRKLKRLRDKREYTFYGDATKLAMCIAAGDWNDYWEQMDKDSGLWGACERRY